jgi:redox-regulated HSP33 family molecular chaperone
MIRRGARAALVRDLRTQVTRVTRQRDSLAQQASSLLGRVAVLEAELAARPEPVVVVVDGNGAVRDALAGIDRTLTGIEAGQ